MSTAADAVKKSEAGPGRTALREARRQQLIDATIESIGKRGFAATTLNSVTEEAKLSHGVVNFHFKSKEVLYVETLGYLAKEHFEHWTAALAKAGPRPEAQLAAIIGVDFERNICATKKLAVWFAFWGQAIHRPVYLNIHNEYDDQRYTELSRLCAVLATDGGYSHIVPEVTARNIEALIDGLWLQLLMYPKTLKRQEARDNCFSFLSDLFPKHFPRSPEKPD